MTNRENPIHRIKSYPGSGSVSGSADPDPDPNQNDMDPKHCLNVLKSFLKRNCHQTPPPPFSPSNLLEIF